VEGLGGASVGWCVGSAEAVHGLIAMEHGDRWDESVCMRWWIRINSTTPPPPLDGEAKRACSSHYCAPFFKKEKQGNQVHEETLSSSGVL
jgi:hypothetical protein